MALEDAPRPSLHDDEDGTAAVEFVVLLPVYLLMVAGLFAISFMAGARQALPIVARYEAWAGGLQPSEIEEIMGPNGSYSVVGEVETTNKPLSLEKTLGELRKQQRHVPMAQAILLNDLGGDFAAPFERRTLTARFDYTGLQIFGTPGIDGFEVDAATYVALPHARKVHESGQQEHFVEEDGFRPETVNAGDVPSKNEYLPAKFGNFRGQGPSMGRDPGVWDIHARIGGSEQAEHGRTRVWKTNR